MTWNPSNNDCDLAENAWPSGYSENIGFEWYPHGKKAVPVVLRAIGYIEGNRAALLQLGHGKLFVMTGREATIAVLVISGCRKAVRDE